MPRIVSLNTFDRPSGGREVNKKYFFALEGTSTEVKYIKNIIARKKTNAQVFYFYKKNNDEISSNLYAITCYIESCIKNNSKFDYPYENLINVIFEAFSSKKLIVNKDKLRGSITKYLNTIGKTINDNVDLAIVEDIVQRLKKQYCAKNISEIIDNNNLIDVIENQSTYIPGIDDVIIIGDRDRKSFTQFAETLKKCGELGFKLIINNPCIEFWFLLHYTDGTGIDMSEWETAANAAKLVYNELKQFDSHYGKKNYDCDKYLALTQVALSNVKKYCVDITNLENQLGSNMPDLFKIIDEM